MYGVPSKILEAINILLKDTVSEVLKPDRDNEFLRCSRWSSKMMVLASFLFIIELVY